MHILLVNRFFGPTQVPTGRMLYDVACELEKSGHSIQVLTSQSSYSIPSEPRRISTFKNIKYIWVGNDKNRLISWILFWFLVCLQIPVMKWDRCVVLTDPPFMICAAWMSNFIRNKKRKIFWWTMDLYPECLVAGGIIKPSGFAYKLLFRLNEPGLSKSCGVICLGNRQRKRLGSYNAWQRRDEFCIVIPPWDYRKIKKVLPDGNRFISDNNLNHKKIALYAGNLYHSAQTSQKRRHRR